MSTTTINIRVDSDVKKQAQSVFGSLGLDMTTAVNVFLRQAIQARGLPFPVVERPNAPIASARPEIREGEASPTDGLTPRRTDMFGCMAGKIRIAEDFDAPLDDFEEYM